MSGDWAEARERILVWAHLLIVLGFLVYLPHSKHLHIATAAINVWFGRTRSARPARAARLRRVPDEEMRFGVATRSPT